MGGGGGAGAAAGGCDWLQRVTVAGTRGKCGRGTVHADAVARGNLARLQKLPGDPGPLAARAEELRADGQTVMFVVVDAQPAGLLAVGELGRVGPTARGTRGAGLCRVFGVGWSGQAN